MTISQARDRLCARLSAIGFPNNIKLPIVDLVNKWVSCSGPQWTVERLKAMKVDLIRSWGGLPPIGKGVRYCKRGLPRGPFRPLWSLGSEKGRLKALSALMVYSSYLAPQVTTRQYEKFVGSVQKLEVPGEVSIDYLRKQMSGVAQFGFLTRIKPFFGKPLSDPEFDRYPWSPTRRRPTLEGPTKPELTEGGSTPLDDVFWMVVASPGFRGLLMKSETLQKALPGDFRDEIVGKAEVMSYLDEKDDYDGTFDEVNNDNVGRISFIQEPGYKLRAVANPLRIYQVALLPLQKRLDAMLQRQPWSSVHNQEGGITEVQRQLRRGAVVHTIDLSDATNNFPVQLQIDVIRSLGTLSDCSGFNSPLELFVDVSKAPWLLKPMGQGSFKTVRWNVGQPLGLGPSFAAFTLAHGYLLEAIDRKVRKCWSGGDSKYEPTFRIIGDDVAIWDTRVAERYRDLLSIGDVPISEQKCLVSNQVSEFGGRVITSERVYPQLKWRDPSNNSFVDIARNLGPQSLSLFTPRQRGLLKAISEVPREIGGLGWNPKGLPYDVRANTDIAKALAVGELAQFYEKGLSSTNHVRYLSQYIHEFVPLHPITPLRQEVEPVPVRKRKRKSPSKEDILSSCNVLREKFLSTEKPGPEWRNPVKVSDPRGPTLATTLERKLDGVLPKTVSKGLSR